jgi:hypothetical protein
MDPDSDPAFTKKKLDLDSEAPKKYARKMQKNM